MAKPKVRARKSPDTGTTPAARPELLSIEICTDTGEMMLDKDELLVDEEMVSSEIFDNESSTARYSHTARKKLEEHMEMMRLRRLLDDYYYEDK